METESTCETPTPSSENVSISCDNSFAEMSDFTSSEQNSETQSLSISNKISPLRGGSNCAEACSTEKALEKDQQNLVSCPDNTPDITKLVLKPPDVTLNTVKEPSSSCTHPGNSSQLSASRRVNNSPSTYHIKMIEFQTRKVSIITQNENGPCPLIAILNVLSLRDRINFLSNNDVISSEDLMNYFFSDCILNYVQRNTSNNGPSVEQNVQDLMAIVPKLQTGLDVNIRFTGVKNFEYTPECDLFDLLNINLYHGWLPEQDEVVRAIDNCSYNQLVEKIIKNQLSTDLELKHDALVAENFLQNTAAQLTYHGLCELNSTLNDDELAVLFRNNHFVTVYKRENQLYQLVTDQGFSSETGVVWETLSNIEGDSQFVDGKFKNVPPMAVSEISAGVTNHAQQIDTDYMVALSLHQDQEKEAEKTKSWDEYKQKLGLTSQSTDEELARQLQNEENAAAHTQRASEEAKVNKKKNCVIS